MAQELKKVMCLASSHTRLLVRGMVVMHCMHCQPEKLKSQVQVFLFCSNEKGASWAYATPGFGASLAPAHLKMLRQMSMPEVDEASKASPLPYKIILEQF